VGAIVTLSLAGIALVTGLGARSASEGSELIGTPAPGWNVSEWIGAAPLSFASLRGKVVLVRWFTSAECPFCHATAPALIRLHRDYAARGLVVVGMYHHKRPEPLTLDWVRKSVKEYGFTFPVGVDRDWRTLNRWWLDGRKRDFTSVSFLLDRRGVIRRIHRGGSMELGTPDFAAMQAEVERLLAEDNATPPR
jgi:thiol-disulfide isomerase/thioredoxin